MKNTLIRRYISKSRKARDVSCGQVSKNEWGGEVWCFNAFGSSLSRFLSSFGFSSQVILTLPYRFRISIHGRDNRRSEQHELGRWFPEEEPDSSFQHQETIVLLRQPRQGTHFSIYFWNQRSVSIEEIIVWLLSIKRFNLSGNFYTLAVLWESQRCKLWLVCWLLML